MKANEIQIGDWVYSSFFGITQIKAIKEYEGYGWVVTTTDENWKSDASLSPIPLTAEILEKNGFVKVNSQRYEYGHPNTDCYVKVNPKKTMMHINGRNANSNLYLHIFVHELQHALRLCGLNALADDFKV